ncbi:MAG TPA: c-type cytochrome [Gaiellaceae bacterium]|nr:c-type cytochrome [Gaiellaceae bacterium]
MVLALTTGHKIGLVVVGAIFIAYALVCALLLPRRYPGFPGRFRTQYFIVTAILFVAMIGGVIVFGKEQKTAPAGAAGAPATPSATSIALGGDPVAGKAIFIRETCETCHVFKAAGFNKPSSTATLGPPLDNLAAYAKKAHYQLDYFIRASILAPPGPYVPPGYPTTLMSTDYGHEMSALDINNVIAFLLQGLQKK